MNTRIMFARSVAGAAMFCLVGCSSSPTADNMPFEVRDCHFFETRYGPALSMTLIVSNDTQMTQYLKRAWLSTIYDSFNVVECHSGRKLPCSLATNNYWSYDCIDVMPGEAVICGGTYWPQGLTNGYYAVTFSLNWGRRKYVSIPVRYESGGDVDNSLVLSFVPMDELSILKIPPKMLPRGKK